MSQASMTGEQHSNKADSQGSIPYDKKNRFVYQDDEIIEKPFNWAQMRRLLTYMKPYKRQLLPILVILMILGTLTKLAIPFLISYAIDHAIAPEPGVDPSMKLLLIITGTAFVLYVIQ